MAASKELARPEAKELSQKEVAALRREAFELETRIKQGLGAQHSVEWLIAEALYEFEERQGWKVLGYDSVVEFCAQPEIGMEKSKYYLYVQMWRELVVSKRVSARTEKRTIETKGKKPKEVEVTVVPELEGASPTKVAEVLPAIKRGDVDVKEALDDARDLGFRDLRTQYRKPDASKGKLDASQEPVRVQCPCCDTWVDEDRLADAPVEVVDGKAKLKVKK